ncbi:hypothetical protein GC207_01980 [bacterium]|nr:hypothetical protein [bacterium]
MVAQENQNPHPLIGSWVNGDEYETEVEYVVSGSEPDFEVRAVDRYDAEEGEVRDIAYDDSTATLFFNVYWNSSGRFIKVRLVAVSPNRVSYTYTFTENQMWFRKDSAPGAAHESPPATAVHESSDNTIPKSESEARAEGGGP